MTASALRVEEWSVFGARDHGGNPCLVVRVGAGHPAQTLQRLAAESATEVTSISRTGRDLRLRFFVPAGETDMCVHGTIAAVTSLVGTNTLAGGSTSGSLSAATAAGPVGISWQSHPPDPVSVAIFQPLRLLGRWLDVAGPIAEALSLPPGAVTDAAGIRSASVGRPKLMVPVTLPGLRSAVPRAAALAALCAEAEVTGVYLFAPRPGGLEEHVVARQFPVDAGIVEDAATGVAAAALAADLADRRGAQRLQLSVWQGEQIGQPSMISAGATTDPATKAVDTWVRGSAARLSVRELGCG
jgi:PhzF family phenazine biosynthesis protein